MKVVPPKLLILIQELESEGWSIWDIGEVSVVAIKKGRRRCFVPVEDHR